MREFAVMLKPASSLCNLRCKYCFYADIAEAREVRSFGIMSQETTKKVLDNIQKDLVAGDHITLSFQGGEPTLAGLPYFQAFVQIVKTWNPGIKVSYALQTNATLLDDDWCRFLAENHFLVGISLDMLPACHNAQRPDASQQGTFSRVMAAKKLLDQYKVEYNVLCTLTNELARHPTQIWKQIQQQDLRYVQFTPCMSELNTDTPSVYALTPKRFASFYTQLFPLWLDALKKNNYYSIKLFDDLVNLLALGRPTACGIDGHCRPQIIVEADGSVYPCDFYATDEYKIGSLTESSLLELFRSPNVATFLNRPHPQPALCANCRYYRICHGNCKRMQENICLQPNDSYCGYQAFLDSCIGPLSQIARSVRR